jgi:hypothetical protein
MSSGTCASVLMLLTAYCVKPPSVVKPLARWPLLAAAAAGVHLDRDAVADLVLVDGGAELHDRAHVFMARGEVLVEGHAALDQRRRAVLDDLQVGGAHGDGVDAHQHLGGTGLRHRLVHVGQLAGIAQDPGLHRAGDVVTALAQEGGVGGAVHRVS